MYRFCFHLRTRRETERPGSGDGAAGGGAGGTAGGEAATAAGTGGQAAGTAEAAEGSQGSLTEFRVVELSLPPPAQPLSGGDSTGAEGGEGEVGGRRRLRLAGSVRKALARLFAACDIEVCGNQVDAVVR